MFASGKTFKISSVSFRVAAAVATLLSAIGLSNAFAQAQTIDYGSRDPNLILVDGSSTVFPITEAVAEEYQNNNPQVNVAVGVSGTGGGFKKFLS